MKGEVYGFEESSPGYYEEGVSLVNKLSVKVVSFMAVTYSEVCLIRH